MMNQFPLFHFFVPCEKIAVSRKFILCFYWLVKRKADSFVFFGEIYFEESEKCLTRFGNSFVVNRGRAKTK